jgi:hypothetical protein
MPRAARRALKVVVGLLALAVADDVAQDALRALFVLLRSVLQ